MTRTADDEVQAAWGQMAFNVSMAPNVYATARSGKAFRGTVTAEPVVPLTAGNVTAPIPVRVADERGWKLPHRNVKNGEPAEGYTLRDRRTGEVLKYGETTRGKARYSQKQLEEMNAVMVFEASGTKTEMHQWQHDRILEYQAQHGGQRPPQNRSDY
jgi:hypothetical protein